MTTPTLTHTHTHTLCCECGKTEGTTPSLTNAIGKAPLWRCADCWRSYLAKLERIFGAILASKE